MASINGQKVNNAKLVDPSTLLAAGINPKTGLPIRLSEGDCLLKEEIRHQLRVYDERQAVNVFTWYNLPNGLDGQLLERILYYKGQGMFFKLQDKFYFLPYALDGTIDVYGRFTGVTPLPFNGKSSTDKNAWITGLTRKPIYDIQLDVDEDTWEGGCVLLSDYTKQISQMNTPRSTLQEPILDAMSEAIPLARTNLIANSGVTGLRVGDTDEQSNVEIANRSVFKAALEGKPWIPMIGKIDFQALTSGGSMQTSEYLEYLQSLDNLRLEFLGIDSGGVFQKKAHLLQSEQAMNSNNIGLVLQDGLTNRQKFCDIVNNIWGLGIWCDVSETIKGLDVNMDGVIADEQDQSGIPGEQPQEVTQDE